MNAAEIANALHGRPKSGGGFLCRCPLPGHGKGRGDRRPSLSVDDGEGGRLLVRCFSGCDPVDILRELASRGLLPERADKDFNTLRGDRRRRPPTRAAAPPMTPNPRALEIWRASRPSPGSPAEKYLRHRGITLSLPPSLRFHPALDYFDGPAVPGGAITLPALVAGVQAPDRRLVAIHRTWLSPDCTGKAKLSAPKKMLGPCAGGAVRLAAAGEVLLIGEGIETTLAAMQATGTPAWAALSTSGLRSLILPPEVHEVTIAADGDADGDAAADVAADRWTAEGRTVRIARPPDGHDFADVLAGEVFAKVEVPHG